jgi:hypothetical protein
MLLRWESERNVPHEVAQGVRICTATNPFDALLG